jgi:hypothetical protein
VPGLFVWVVALVPRWLFLGLWQERECSSVLVGTLALVGEWGLHVVLLGLWFGLFLVGWVLFLGF